MGSDMSNVADAGFVRPLKAELLLQAVRSQYAYGPGFGWVAAVTDLSP